MNPFEFIVIAIATWRLAYLLVHESGPFKVMERIRAWNNFGGLLDCVYCASIWAAALIVFVWQFNILRKPIIAVGASGAALLVQRYAGMGD